MSRNFKSFERCNWPMRDWGPWRITRRRVAILMTSSSLPSSYDEQALFRSSNCCRRASMRPRSLLVTVPDVGRRCCLTRINSRWGQLAEVMDRVAAGKHGTRPARNLHAPCPSPNECKPDINDRRLGSTPAWDIYSILKSSTVSIDQSVTVARRRPAR